MNTQEFKALQAKLESIWNEEPVVAEAPADIVEEQGDSQYAIQDLKDILNQLEDLSQQARSIVADHFPREMSRAEAYGVFDFGSSRNQYDNTFASMIKDLEDELKYDEE
jgi:hypothetical protein